MADREITDKNFGSNEPYPEARAVNDFHKNSDVNTGPEAQHHTLGTGVNQASPGSHSHNGEDSVFLFRDMSISGSRSDGTALLMLLNALETLGLKHETTP